MSGARLINCPSCGGSIAIKAAGFTTTVACQYCASELDVTNPDVRLITEYHQAVSQLEIPLGARGSIYGLDWEVIGALERSDDEMSWSEFLLFNPYAGYRWLIHADDEWSIGTMTTAIPTSLSAETVDYVGQRFVRDYDPVRTRTDKVLGEFYWRVRAGDVVEAATYSNDDQTLSCEYGGGEVTWTLIDYPSSGSRIADSFSGGYDGGGPPPPPITPSGPRQFGRKQVASAPAKALYRPEVSQKKEFPSDLEDLFTMALMGAGTLLLIILISVVFGSGGRAANQTASIQTGATDQTIPVATLTLTRPYQVVTVTTRGSEFVNRWVDLDYSLVDRKTQRSIDAYGLIEYYAGRDSDGNWTEGSRTRETKFSGVPAGTYDLMLDASASRWVDPKASTWSSSVDGDSAYQSDMIDLYISAKPGGVFVGNILVLALLTFAPLGVWIYRKMQRGY